MSPSKDSIIELLPNEIKYKILGLLVDSGDLRSLMASSPAFLETGRRVLYETVVIRINSDGSMYQADLHRFLRAGVRNLALVKHLAVVNASSPNPKRPLPAPVSMTLGGVWRNPLAWHNAVWNMTFLLIEIVTKTRALRSFRCSHYLGVGLPLLEVLMAVCLDLEHLQIRLFEDDFNPQRIPICRFPVKSNHLKTLEIRGTYDYDRFTASTSPFIPFVQDVISTNRNTLQKVVLGQESFVAQAYKADHNYMTRTFPWDLKTGFARNLRPSPKIPHLSSLDLIAAEVRYVHPVTCRTLAHYLNFSQLRRLSLESCYGVDDLLRNLSLAMKGAIFLKEFRFRHEAPDSGMLSSLEGFLCGFTGLELLSILLDNTDNMPNHVNILQTHGPTLQALVWEGRCRRPPRNSISLEGQTDGQLSFLECLPRYCSDLKELSIPLDVNVTYTTVPASRRIEKGLAFKVLELPHLKTLHIRTSAAINRSTVDQRLVLHSNKTAVTKFLDYGTHYRRTYPILKLVAVGPLTYEDRWVLDRPTRMRSVFGPVRPLFFDVVANKNWHGEYEHMLQPIGRFHYRLVTPFVSATVDMIHESYFHTKVFDSFWLK